MSLARVRRIEKSIPDRTELAEEIKEFFRCNVVAVVVVSMMLISGLSGPLFEAMYLKFFTNRAL